LEAAIRSSGNDPFRDNVGCMLQQQNLITQLASTLKVSEIDGSILFSSSTPHQNPSLQGLIFNF
jgi:hypothetical protein